MLLINSVQSVGSDWRHRHATEHAICCKSIHHHHNCKRSDHCLSLHLNYSFSQPEKWDSLTRSWRKHLFLLGAIDILLIDEVHHLGEDRGATLETIVVRMRSLNMAYFRKLESMSVDPAAPESVRKTLQNFRYIRSNCMFHLKKHHIFQGNENRCPQCNVAKPGGYWSMAQL